MTAIIVIVVVVILAAWLVSMYNSLVKMRNNRENAFADIDVQLKQRHDLVPQLVETVKRICGSRKRYVGAGYQCPQRGYRCQNH